MRRGRLVVALALVAAGCAAIAGIDDREGTRCARESHDICEDYDNEKALHVWTGPRLEDEPTVTGTIVPSDRSFPNAFELKLPAAAEDAGARGIFGNSFERSPDGLEVSFDVRVDDLTLGDAADPLDGDSGGPPIPFSTLALCVVQWNRGVVAVSLRHDGAFLYLATRPDETAIGNFYKKIDLATRDQILHRWSHVEITVLLSATPPAVEIRFGDNPNRTPQLDPSTKDLARTTTVIFGGATVGPTGPNRITLDNLIADFPHDQ